jgi:DNA-binding NtrC family response regulator
MSAISSEALGLLERYAWPGNVRQLEHVINQVVIMNQGTELTPEMLPTEIRETGQLGVTAIDTETAKDASRTVPTISEMERQLILEALHLTSGSVPEAAKQLGLSSATLYRKVKKFGIGRAWSEGKGPASSS